MEKIVYSVFSKTKPLTYRFILLHFEGTEFCTVTAVGEVKQSGVDGRFDGRLGTYNRSYYGFPRFLLNLYVQLDRKRLIAA